MCLICARGRIGILLKEDFGFIAMIYIIMMRGKSSKGTIRTEEAVNDNYRAIRWKVGLEVMIRIVIDGRPGECSTWSFVAVKASFISTAKAGGKTFCVKPCTMQV